MFRITVVSRESGDRFLVAEEDFENSEFNPRRVVDFLDLLGIRVCLPVHGSDPSFVMSFFGRFLISNCYVSVCDYGDRASIRDFELDSIVFSRSSFSEFLDFIRVSFVDSYSGPLGGDLDD